MDSINDLKRLAILAVVADEGGFSAAARKLSLSKAAVSKQVALLEHELGARLLHRSTRRVGPTEVGEAVLAHARRVRAEAQAARDAAGRLGDAPTGTLRVTAPLGLGQRFIATVLAAFARQYPRLGVELVLADEPLDLVAHGIDVAIRGGRLPDSSLRQRKLGNLELVTCAAPSYLASHGSPRRPADLHAHTWIVYTPMGRPQRVELSSSGGREMLRLDGPLATNDGEVARAWAVAGLGIALLPRFWVDADLAAGRLTVVLPRHVVRGAAVYALHPYQGRPPAKVRAFVDALRQHTAIWGVVARATAR